MVKSLDLDVALRLRLLLFGLGDVALVFYAQYQAVLSNLRLNTLSSFWSGAFQTPEPQKKVWFLFGRFDCLFLGIVSTLSDQSR